MPNHPGSNQQPNDARLGVCHEGQVRFDIPLGWPDGTVVRVVPELPPAPSAERPVDSQYVVVAGFGLAGRFIVDLLAQWQIDHTIIERNPETVRTQSQLGRRIIEGNAASRETLLSAELPRATTLALTMPDEEAVLAATAVARSLNPQAHIIARTYFASKGMQAIGAGANEVIKAEQVVATFFYEAMLRQLYRSVIAPTSELNAPS